MRKRRGRGEGSVFQRGDGAWVGSLTTGYDERGRRRRRVVYGKTKAEVLERLSRLRHDAITGMLGEPTRLTVAEFLHRWLEDAARSAIRESTYRIYESLIRIHIAPRIGGIVLTKLQPPHIQGLLTEMEEDGASPKLRLLTYGVLHRALKQAVIWQMVPRNVCEGVVRPRVPRKEMQTLAPEQARKFLDAAKADRFYALYAVLLGTGLRAGEALGLTWPDVDLERGLLHVRRQLCEVAGRLWLQEPKTKRAQRNVDLPAFAVEALRDHQDRARAAGTLVNDHLLVFTDGQGGPVRKSNLRRRSFEPLLRKAGLPRIRLHDLRHTSATLALMQGVHPKVVQERLGHSTISMTLDTYSHVLPSMQKEAAAKMDAMFTGG